MPEQYPQSFPAGQRTLSTKEWLTIETRTDADEGYGDLKQMLEKKHPEWTTLYPFWRMAGDFAFNRVKSEADKAQYLEQFTNEGAKAYAIRCKVSAFAPETPQLLEDFIATLFNQPASREPKEGIHAEIARRMQMFIDAAGLCGETLDELARKAVALAAVYNRVDGVLDHPLEESTETPYLYLIPPENRFDWDENEDGKLLWCKYHQRYYVKEKWDSDKLQVDEYRIVDSEKFETYRVILNERTGDESIVGPLTAPHVFPEIPVKTLWWQKDGEAWAKVLCELDKRVFQVESDHAFDLSEAGHPPVLAWLHKEDDKGQTQGFIDRVKQGIEKVLHLNPGDGDQQPENIQRLELDIGPMEHQTTHAQTLRQRIRILAGAGTEGVEEEGMSMQPESGVALSIKREAKEKRQQIASHNAEGFEKAIISLVVLEGSVPPDDFDITGLITLQYPNEFDQRDVSEIAQLIPVADEIGSPTLSKMIRKAEARKMVGSGADQGVLQGIDDEIEDAVDTGMVGLTEGEKAAQEQEFNAEQADADREVKKKEKPNGK